MSDMIAETELLTVKEVSKRLRLSHSFLYKEINSGRLVARKARRKTVIRVADINAWIASLPPYAPRPRAD